jgi:hypothetical protein
VRADRRGRRLRAVPRRRGGQAIARQGRPRRTRRTGLRGDPARRLRVLRRGRSGQPARSGPGADRRHGGWLCRWTGRARRRGGARDDLARTARHHLRHLGVVAIGVAGMVGVTGAVGGVGFTAGWRAVDGGRDERRPVRSGGVTVTSAVMVTVGVMVTGVEPRAASMRVGRRLGGIQGGGDRLGGGFGAPPAVVRSRRCLLRLLARILRAQHTHRLDPLVGVPTGP